MHEKQGQGFIDRRQERRNEWRRNFLSRDLMKHPSLLSLEIKRHIPGEKHFEHKGFLKKVVIFELKTGEKEKTAKLIFKNVYGAIEEVDVWQIPNTKKNE
jgi:hypothetical protein